MNGKSEAEPPTVARDEYERFVRNERSREPRPSQDPGKPLACPDCGRKTLLWSNALSAVVAKRQQALALRRLTGFRCASCQVELLDYASEVEVERERQDALVANYEVSLSKLGSRRAILLNKDLMRIAEPDDVQGVVVTPMDRDHWLVELRRKARSQPSPTDEHQAVEAAKARFLQARKDPASMVSTDEARRRVRRLRERG